MKRHVALIVEVLSRLINGDEIETPIQLIQPLGVATRQSTDVVAIDDREIAAALHYIREHACRGLSVADYKLMEHLLTGEQKLFNVATDYRELSNLINENPQKASELKAVMSEYLSSIDAEDVQDVYQARLAELDRFEEQARAVHAQKIQRAGGDRKLIAAADERLASDLARFEENREECREIMRGKSF